MDQQNYYKTKDFGEAATLICQGFEFTGLEETGRHKEFMFLFTPGQDIKETIERYYRREIRLEPQDFQHHEKQLKTLLRWKLEK